MGISCFFPTKMKISFGKRRDLGSKAHSFFNVRYTYLLFDENRNKNNNKNNGECDENLDSDADSEDDDLFGGIITETLAELLANQGQIEKAIKMYEKLSLIFPNKSAFFAAKIEQLKSNIT